MSIQHDVAVLCGDAIRSIERKGWAQGSTAQDSTVDGAAKTCLWMALHDAMLAHRNIYDDWWRNWVHWNQVGDQAMAMVATAIPVTFVKEHNLIKLGSPAILVQWNDQPERTEDEVLAVLRRVQQVALIGAESP